jgi:hypothetical protein
MPVELECGAPPEVVTLTGTARAETRDNVTAVQAAHDNMEKGIREKIGKLHADYHCKPPCEGNPAIRKLSGPKIVVGTDGWETRTVWLKSSYGTHRDWNFEETYQVYVFSLTWTVTAEISCIPRSGG